MLRPFTHMDVICVYTAVSMSTITVVIAQDYRLYIHISTRREGSRPYSVKEWEDRYIDEHPRRSAGGAQWSGLSLDNNIFVGLARTHM